MDSFYGAPRQPPRPPMIRPIERAPTVPEVSVIDNGFPPQIRNFGMCAPNFPMHASKHVRFKSPQNEPFFGKENVPQTLKTVPDLKGKTFKQIYMANVPDRHLDLSIFEPPKSETVPKTDCGIFTESVQRLQSIENKPASPKYRDSSPIVFRSSLPRTKPPCTEICTQTEPSNTEIAPANDEPTIKDLFRIIQQQNEQIMLLQRQVNNLRTSIRQPEIDSVPHDESPTKKGLFSFDVKATSFEFSFRPPQKFRKNEFLEPRIQEIMEGDSNSLHLDQSLDVKDSYVSSAPSIAIEMDNYSSDEEEPEVGVTFYKDLMKQVNTALKKAQRQSECSKDAAKGQTMNAVKQATLQHLKKIGVNLAPIQESSEVTKGSDLESESEISCAVQQLLMKYLPSEKLAKVVNKPAKAPPQNNSAPQGGEYSFATLQYMKKYNLIDSSKRSSETAPRILDVTALKLQPKLL